MAFLSCRFILSSFERRFLGERNSQHHYLSVFSAVALQNKLSMDSNSHVHFVLTGRPRDTKRSGFKTNQIFSNEDSAWINDRFLYYWQACNRRGSSSSKPGGFGPLKWFITVIFPHVDAITAGRRYDGLRWFFGDIISIKDQVEARSCTQGLLIIRTTFLNKIIDKRTLLDLPKHIRHVDINPACTWTFAKHYRQKL